MEKALLNLDEFCHYINCGKTKGREILKRKDSSFTVKVGNRLYANKKLLDDHLEKCAKYQIGL